MQELKIEQKMIGMRVMEIARSIAAAIPADTGASLTLDATGCHGLVAYVAGLPKEFRDGLDASRLRPMLEAMQAGELTVSRGLELLDMWLYGNYSDELLPTFSTNEALDHDTLPLDMIRGLQMRASELEDEIKALMAAAQAPCADSSLPYGLSWADAPEWATVLVAGENDILLMWAKEFKEGVNGIRAQTAYVRSDVTDAKVGGIRELHTTASHQWRVIAARPAAPAPQETAADSVSLEKVEGDMLPAIGDTVLIRMFGTTDDWARYRVTGYYVLGGTGRNATVYSIFVRAVDAAGCRVSRRLSDVRRISQEGGAEC